MGLSTTEDARKETWVRGLVCGLISGRARTSLRFGHTLHDLLNMLSAPRPGCLLTNFARHLVAHGKSRPLFIG
jgi:hypothetical protein